MLYKTKITFLQIGFFICFVLMSVYFGGGGDGSLIPYIIFFGPFAVLIDLPSQVFSFFNINVGEYFILVVSALNISMLICQPIVYNLIWRKYYDKIYDKKYLKYLLLVHLSSIFILSLVMLKNEVLRVSIHDIILSVSVAAIFSVVYWVSYFKSLKCS